MRFIKYTHPRKEFSDRQVEFLLRDGTSDQKSVDETFKKNAYQRKSAGFLVEPGERWLDMGANIGAFTAYALRKGARVRSYEPEEEARLCIERNLAHNGLTGEIYEYAIVPDSQDGQQLTFFVQGNPKAQRRHTLYPDYLNSKAKANVTTATVQAKGFSSLFTGGFDCAKINIEGAEIPIIIEQQDFSFVRKMVFEYSFDMDKRMASFIAIKNKLEQHFDRVDLSKSNMPYHLETYPYYPPNCYIFCQNTKQ